jgi:cytochrome c-type biogenesis protein CcmH/NrfF
MILSNKSNEEIYQFMVERYGDFVVFKPPINWKTYLLWFAPLAFLIFCLIYLIRSTKTKDTIVNNSSVDIEKAKRLLK